MSIAQEPMRAELIFDTNRRFHDNAARQKHHTGRPTVSRYGPVDPTKAKGIVLDDLSAVAITQEDGPVERGRNIPTAGIGIGSEPKTTERHMDSRMLTRAFLCGQNQNGKSIPHPDGISLETRGRNGSNHGKNVQVGARFPKGRPAAKLVIAPTSKS